MSEFERQAYQRYGQAVPGAEAGVVDQGLREYMLRVYNYMATGLAITGLAALAVAWAAVTADPSAGVAQIGEGRYLTDIGYALYVSPLKWLVILAPLGLVFFMGARVGNMSVQGAQTMFWVFAGLMGLSISSVFLVFTGESITRVFFVTAAAFGALSLYGYTTKRDMSGWGSFLIMGLFGVIIAMIVNIFLQSSALQFAVSVIGVLVFAGLTAYDTQRIKEMYHVNDDGTVAGRKAIMGALSLYLNFINMFMMLLHLFGNRE